MRSDSYVAVYLSVRVWTVSDTGVSGPERAVELLPLWTSWFNSRRRMPGLVAIDRPVSIGGGWVSIRVRV